MYNPSYSSLTREILVSLGPLLEVFASLASVAAAFIAWKAIRPVVRSLELAAESISEARKARRVALVLELSERYGKDEMHEALAYIGQRRDQYADVTAMVNAYVEEELKANGSNCLTPWNRARRKVSKFFLGVRALCAAEVLDEELLAETLKLATFELYINTVSLLDDAHNRRVLRRADFDDATSSFFRTFLGRHFAESHHHPAGGSRERDRELPSRASAAGYRGPPT